MTDLYLIAHKVRGEAAFDIATQIPCPECSPEGMLCGECDNGFWWIIPTSGHRAHPYFNITLSEIDDIGWSEIDRMPMPIDLPDHYPVRASPKEPKRNLLAELGLSKPANHPAIVGKLNRRI